ncbi:MAG: serine protease [Clostridia bacterium]|nr:serine protease [Clostridia bacterium]
MSYKKILLCFVFIFVMVFNTGCGTELSSNDSNSSNNSQNFDSTITNLQAIELTAETSPSDMVSSYREATATVLIYNSDTNNAVSMGSGVAVYSGGYIATNWHVISNVDSYPSAYYIKIQFMIDGEMTYANASLLWSSSAFDLAIIRSEYVNMPFVTMADKWIDSDNRLEYFEDVWTIGTPYDMSLYGTASRGYISCDMERTSSSDGRIYESMIQHTAPISNGSSGSGLFDMDGNLLALNTLGVASSSSVTASSLFFATPIYPIINIIEEIATLEEDEDTETNYSFPKLDVMGYDRFMNSTFTEKGLYTETINPNSPCENILFEGDIIKAISTTSATQEGDAGYYKVDKRNDFLYAVSNFKKGDTVKLYINNISGDSIVQVVLG